MENFDFDKYEWSFDDVARCYYRCLEVLEDVNFRELEMLWYIRHLGFGQTSRYYRLFQEKYRINGEIFSSIL